MAAERPGKSSPKLSEQQCEPCAAGAEPLRGQELSDLLAQVPQWEAVEERMITRTFAFPDFESALDFTDEVGELAEQQNHHPDIHLSYGQVKVDLSTHKINGLSENDFILAAKIDEIAQESDLA